MNAQLQTTAPHVHALGDNTQYASESAGVSRTLPYVRPIMAAAKVEEGIWHFVDALGQVRGFVLSGTQTSRRAEQAKRVTA